MLYGIALPEYDEIKHLENKGFYAVGKYYKFPYNLFYCYKFKMIVDMLGSKQFYNIIDFGSGSGIFKTELLRHAERVFQYEKDDPFNPSWKFDVVVLASVLEFTNVLTVIKQVKSILRPGGFVVGASPMSTWISRLYFKTIRDYSFRHGHEYILEQLKDSFSYVEYKMWKGLYFSFKAYI